MNKLVNKQPTQTIGAELLKTAIRPQRKLINFHFPLTLVDLFYSGASDFKQFEVYVLIFVLLICIFQRSSSWKKTGHKDAR